MPINLSLEVAIRGAPFNNYALMLYKTQQDSTNKKTVIIYPLHPTTG